MILFALIFILFGENAQAAKLTIYGETHDASRCVSQRTSLANSAANGTGLFFTENAFTPEWTDPWSSQRIQSFLNGEQTSPRVQGIESPYSWTIGTYFRDQNLFERERADAIRIGAHPRSRSKQRDREVHLISARGWLDHFLSDMGIYENERVHSAFCRGIDYDPGAAYSLRDEALLGYIQGAASRIMDQLNASVREQTSIVSRELGVSSVVQKRHERRWVRHHDRAFNRDEIDYLIIWRNYVMQKNLSLALDRTDPGQREDIHVVLGAAHVAHFYNTLVRDYPKLARRYQIQVNFNCLDPDLKKFYSRTLGKTE